VSEVVTQGFQRMAPLYRPVADVVAEVVEEMHLRNEHPDLGGYRTGLDCFDKHAREALQPGRLLLVAGESGKGKTAFAAQLAVSFSAQVPTLLVTLEDDERSTVRRQLANVSRESVGKIRAGFHGAAGRPVAGAVRSRLPRHARAGHSRSGRPVGRADRAAGVAVG
jgi:replicative DNA helicase